MGERYHINDFRDDIDIASVKGGDTILFPDQDTILQIRTSEEAAALAAEVAAKSWLSRAWWRVNQFCYCVRFVARVNPAGVPGLIWKYFRSEPS